MLFFALFFLLTSLYGLLKGRLFHSVLLDSAKANIQKARGDIKELPKETVSKLLIVCLYFIIITISQIIFVVNSLNRDPYLFPTLGIIMLVFFKFLINMAKTSADLSNEENRAKYLVKQSRRYSLSRVITNLVYISYFGYMLAVLLHLIK